MGRATVAGGSFDRSPSFNTSEAQMNNGTRELIIIGGGPAGYTAALYAARANLQPLVIEGFAWGGPLRITSDGENYPGYADGIMGPAMMQDFRRQAERFGAEFITDDVTKVDFREHPFRVWVGDTVHTSVSVIVATGASARQPTWNALAVIGPHPDGGGRFYGVTNQVETLLLAPALVLGALAGTRLLPAFALVIAA